MNKKYDMHIELKEGKRYYSIGEVAKAFDVNASLIRFWDKEFDILKPKKNAKGNRMFTPEDVKNIQHIYHLVKERGFTLDGAKIHLKENQKKSLDTFEIINKLESVKAQLLDIKANL
jgi:DNA-binding transcriptional MerR regulator